MKEIASTLLICFSICVLGVLATITLSNPPPQLPVQKLPVRANHGTQSSSSKLRNQKLESKEETSDNAESVLFKEVESGERLTVAEHPQNKEHVQSDSSWEERHELPAKQETGGTTETATSLRNPYSSLLEEIAERRRRGQIGDNRNHNIYLDSVVVPENLYIEKPSQTEESPSRPNPYLELLRQNAEFHKNTEQENEIGD